MRHPLALARHVALRIHTIFEPTRDRKCFLLQLFILLPVRLRFTDSFILDRRKGETQGPARTSYPSFGDVDDERHGDASIRYPDVNSEDGSREYAEPDEIAQRHQRLQRIDATVCVKSASLHPRKTSLSRRPTYLCSWTCEGGLRAPWQAVLGRSGRTPRKRDFLLRWLMKCSTNPGLICYD